MENAAYLSTWKNYQAAWSDISDEQRRILLEKSVSPTAVYTDPSSEAHGLTELITKIEQSQEKFPGATFQNEKLLDHHGQGLFFWKMLDSKGGLIASGTSYARFDKDNLLTQMTGFF